jgi:carbonic anhydrase/acetyltransferase-like protein (isoleucine patch superfamily)
MNIRPYGGKVPRLAAGARVDESAVVIGDVELGEGVSVWPQAVLRGDFNSIRVGKGTNIQDGCVVHNHHGHPAVIGEDCVVGHLACVHGSTIGDRCLIGIHAIILNGAVVGDECIIGAGALVGEGQKIPPRSLVLGIPGAVRRAVKDEEVAMILESVKHYRAYAEKQLPLGKTQAPDRSDKLDKSDRFREED